MATTMANISKLRIAHATGLLKLMYCKMLNTNARSKRISRKNIFGHNYFFARQLFAAFCWFAFLEHIRITMDVRSSICNCLCSFLTIFLTRNAGTLSHTLLLSVQNFFWTSPNQQQSFFCSSILIQRRYPQVSIKKYF